MRRRRAMLLWRLLWALGALAGAACGPRPAPPAARGELGTPAPAGAGATGIARMASDIDAYVARLSADGAFSGVVLVVLDGAPVIEQGYGWASIEQRVPNGPGTRFRIASLSKSFTAMAIMQLQSQGRLHVGEPICAHLDPCPEAWRPVTIHHLLTHTSGIPDYVAAPGFWEHEAQSRVSAAELIALIADQPLAAAPGARFAYSNSSYLLLGAIVGRVVDPALPAELAYHQFLRRSIFEPLGMRDTGSEACAASPPPLASGYAAAGSPALSCDPSSFFAMGDLYSTAQDLRRWGAALGQDTLLPAELREQMFAPHAATSAYRTWYGYGWYVSEIGGARRAWHAGATPGYRSYFARAVDGETLVIVLSNYEVAPVEAMGREIAAILIRRAADGREPRAGR